VQPGIAQAAFKLPHPDAGQTPVTEVNLFTGDVALVVLNNVITPATVSADKARTTRQQRTSDIAQSEFLYALTTIKAKAEIERNAGTPADAE
jgi:hypothetical protein